MELEVTVTVFSRFDEIKKEEEREKREALLYTANVHVHLVSLYK